MSCTSDGNVFTSHSTEKSQSNNGVDANGNHENQMVKDRNHKCGAKQRRKIPNQFSISLDVYNIRIKMINLF